MKTPAFGFGSPPAPGVLAEKKKRVGKEKMKRSADGSLDERGVLALERVADSMEALVRTSMIVMMKKMETCIKVE